MRGAAVATGLKGPRPDGGVVVGNAGSITSEDLMRQAFRDASATSRAAATRSIKRAQADTSIVVFMSRFGNHRIQITAPADRIDPSTGHIHRARPVAAQFQEGIFALDMRKEGAELAHRHLLDHPAYGVDFWLATDAYEKAKEAAYSNMLNMVLAEPEIAERLVADLKARDFQLPKSPGAGKAEAPDVEHMSDAGADALVESVTRENARERAKRGAGRGSERGAKQGKPKAKSRPVDEDDEEGDDR